MSSLPLSLHLFQRKAFTDISSSFPWRIHVLTVPQEDGTKTNLEAVEALAVILPYVKTGSSRKWLISSDKSATGWAQQTIEAAWIGVRNAETQNCQRREDSTGPKNQFREKTFSEKLQVRAESTGQDNKNSDPILSSSVGKKKGIPKCFLHPLPIPALETTAPSVYPSE